MGNKELTPDEKYEKVIELRDYFLKIIGKWLKKRDECVDGSLCESSEEDSYLPKYVMEMLKEINSEMPKPMLDEIKSKDEFASGHVDYAMKFALYCAELYVDNM